MTSVCEYNTIEIETGEPFAGMRAIIKFVRDDPKKATISFRNKDFSPIHEVPFEVVNAAVQALVERYADKLA